MSTFMWEWVQQLANEGRAAVSESLSANVLIQAELFPLGGNSMDFKTEAMGYGSLTFLNRMKREGRPLRTAMLEHAVFLIRKNPESPWRDRVSVGRAANADLVIRDPSLSKLHAHFVDGGDGFNSLIDAGSTNGTWVNDVRLKGSVPMVLETTDEIIFGRRRFQFYTAQDFLELISVQLAA